MTLLNSHDPVIWCIAVSTRSPLSFWNLGLSEQTNVVVVDADNGSEASGGNVAMLLIP